MNGALMVRWGQNAPGRETNGLEVLGKTVAKFEEYAKEGRVQGHREFFSLTGKQGGFMIIDGQVDELLKILAEEDTIMLNAEAASTVSDFDIEVFAGGDDQTVQQLTGIYTQRMQQLGFM